MYHIQISSKCVTVNNSLIVNDWFLNSGTGAHDSRNEVISFSSGPSKLQSKFNGIVL